MEHLVVMGVAGSGKSTLGQALAGRLGWPFFDADDFHPAENREKMARGEALNDEDRAGWLTALTSLLAQRTGEGRPVVLACSALRQVYRDRLASAGPLVFVYLKVSRPVLAERLAGRVGHFFGPGLLDSQLRLLEVPAGALELDGERPLGELVTLVAGSLGL